MVAEILGSNNHAIQVRQAALHKWRAGAQGEGVQTCKTILVFTGSAGEAIRNPLLAWFSSVTPKIPELRTRSWVRASLDSETSTSGGFNEIEVKELTVMPCRTPSWSELTTATPVAHWRIASRIASGSTDG
jgi:hypothetical protein